MPFYNNSYKTLEELENDYNENKAPKVFSFAGVLHRWCEPEEVYPVVHVSINKFYIIYITHDQNVIFQPSLTYIFSIKLNATLELRRD